MSSDQTLPLPKPVIAGRALLPLAWGMWRLAPLPLAHAETLVAHLVEQGITLFDTADIYGFDGNSGFGDAETLLGRLLSQRPSLRDGIILASKGGIRPGIPYDSGKDYVIAACEASLRRLRTDRIDLYHIHRPDILTPPSDIAEAFLALRQAGKVLDFGVSNFSASQIRLLQSYLPFALSAIQPEFSPLAIAPLSDGLFDLALETRLTVLAWSPLAGGRLTGAGSTAREREVIAALDRLATRHETNRTAVALAWILAHPAGPIPIIGTTRPERIAPSRQALDLRLTRGDWYEVLTASRQEKLP